MTNVKTASDEVSLNSNKAILVSIIGKLSVQDEAIVPINTEFLKFMSILYMCIYTFHPILW